MDFPKDSFDLVWSEGALYQMGFENGLKKCKEFLKKNGYKMVGHFTLPVKSWFKDYYDPMQARINEFRPKYKDNETATTVLDMAQQEIDDFKGCSSEVGYEFFIARNSQ